MSSTQKKSSRALASAILEAMQGEGWIMARDIVEKLIKQGYQTNVRQVSMIIKERLTHLVDRRPLRRDRHWFEYRLLPFYLNMRDEDGKHLRGKHHSVRIRKLKTG